MTEKKPKRPRDPNQLAKLMVDIASGQVSDAEFTASQERSAMGGLGRKKSLTPEQRSEIAKVAAKARWKKKD
ncbi:MAG: hypothetical protein CML99_13615 [Rhodobiaceae bacterium]|nr:hypothetical protein [Rhodobiaceae bacterium]|tara:strand:+ start:211 stop:426 length:216 start_codon:yes stop_codon:yes gene_type:complete